MFSKDEPIDPLVRICFETAEGTVVEGDYDLNELDVAIQHVATRDGFMIARMTLAEYGKCGAYGLKLPFNGGGGFAPKCRAVNGPAIYARVVLTSKGIDVVSTEVGAVSHSGKIYYYDNKSWRIEPPHFDRVQPFERRP